MQRPRRPVYEACRDDGGPCRGVRHLLTLEQGKPLNGLGSRFEIGGAVAWTRHTASLDLPVEVVQDRPEGRVELHRKPIGVVGAITPWNWPVMIGCWHIIPAIRTGNAVVINLCRTRHCPPSACWNCSTQCFRRAWSWPLPRACSGVPSSIAARPAPA
ncbi:MAG: aldehyde dehydrogenase family protein [Hydrogenophaga sp.]|nr:aldehyde dehydrogenase family protein [Hydrogenophaga sp.]